MKLTAGTKVYIKLLGDIEFNLDETAPSMLNGNIESKMELAYFQYWGQETIAQYMDGQMFILTNTVAVLIKEGGDVVSINPNSMYVPMEDQ